MRRLFISLLGISFFLMGLEAANVQKVYAAGSKKKTTQLLKPQELMKVMEEISTLLREAHEAYKQAYRAGRIYSWTDYYRAKKALAKITQLHQKAAATLAKRHPRLAQKFIRQLQKLRILLAKKSHPQKFGQTNYNLLIMTYDVVPYLENELLTSFRESVANIHQSLAAEKIVGSYRIGLKIDPPRPFYRWYLRRHSTKQILIRPPKKSRWMISVFLRNAHSGDPISGAELSIELLDAKSKKQLSTQRLTFVWGNYPLYVGYIPAAPKKNIIIQVSLSPAPVTRTNRSKLLLRERLVAQFPGKIQGSQIIFPKQLKPRSSEARGHHLMLAAATVGGQMKIAGPYRVGLALVPIEPIWDWKSGSLKPHKISRSRNAQLVVFVQDIYTGMFVPNARVEVYLYHRESTGRYRSSYILKPVYDGFPSYRAPIRIVQHQIYRAQVNIRPALTARFNTNRPASYAVEFKGLQTSLATLPTPKKSKKKTPRRRR